MVSLDIEQCTKSRFVFLSIHCALLILIILTSPTYAISDIHKGLENGSGNIDCLKCHSTHKLKPETTQSNIFQSLQSVPENFQSFSSSGVIGNITLITSSGQNWYQQGIYGPNASGNANTDKSWGWTFFDENPASGFITPNETVTQQNKIYALLLDSGNNSSPITGAQVTANVTFWTYDGVSYTNHTSQVQLIEDINKGGLYSGNFYFYGGTDYYGYDMASCDGCHMSYYYGGIDTKVGYFPGNYTAVITANADGKTTTAKTSFEVTPWGCEDCHGSGNQHRTNKNIVPRDMDSACYLCHGINQITHDGTDAGNPHQNTAHRNIQCIDCHTNKSLDPQTFNGVSFTNGGFNNAPLPQYNHETTQLNGGTHTSLSCKDCHDDLMLPDPSGGYRPDNYTISNTINLYDPSFASLNKFSDYYVINITQGGPLNVSFDWEGTSNIGFYLYPPNFNPKNRSTPLSPNKGDYPYYDGATFINKPEKFSNNTPLSGDWILEVYGYDLIGGYAWFGNLQAPINYTLKSTYPIERKDLPKIPECNDCHNSGASDSAFTTDQIPDWNPGFAHVDTNNDGAPDIQCRMCHDAMHEITVKNCRNCHTIPQINHPIQEPLFAQYTPAECLNCHGDPHVVTSAGGTDCIACHSQDVNISLFGRHGKINDSNKAGNVTNDDCWTCHYQKDMDRSNVYLCESCHINSTGVVNVTDPALIKGDLMHGMTTCKTCHTPATPGIPKAPAYHLNGSVGPLGLVEKILEKFK